jgi:hypothetical protein
MMTHAPIDDEDDERGDFDFEDVAVVDPAAVLPQLLTRLVPRNTRRHHDFIAATAALMLNYARGIGEYCPRRHCRERGICQKPPALCAMRRYADIYNWDESLAHGPRAKMYEAIEAKPDSDHADEVRKHTPNLARQLLRGR